MRKIVLTSAGFNNKNIGAKFIELVGKPLDEIKVLFIPTAAITDEQKSIIPLCKQDLFDMGISDKNIDSYNFEEIYNSVKVIEYDAIYVCGGDSQHLLNKFNENKLALDTFLENGGVYVGVSAGSIILAQNLKNNLDYINCILNVHRKSGSKPGVIDTKDCPTVDITDNQAIVILNEKIEVIE